LTQPDLTIDILLTEAAAFSIAESTHDEPSLFGVTDGKAIGTYLEHKFVAHLMDKYSFAGGNSALGIDIPSVNVDIKVTSVKQPQSSCPFKSARQKIFGLGYNLIVFVYEKSDDGAARIGRLNMRHTVFIQKERTGDYQMTRGYGRSSSEMETPMILSPSYRTRISPWMTLRHTISRKNFSMRSQNRVT
jgi:hypothetical protein